MVSVFSEGNTVHLSLTHIPVRGNRNLFYAAKEYKCVSLEKPKPNLSPNHLFCNAATQKGGTD